MIPVDDVSKLLDKYFEPALDKYLRMMKNKKMYHETAVLLTKAFLLSSFANDFMEKAREPQNEDVTIQ